MSDYLYDDVHIPDFEYCAYLVIHGGYSPEVRVIRFPVADERAIISWIETEANYYFISEIEANAIRECLESFEDHARSSITHWTYEKRVVSISPLPIS